MFTNKHFINTISILFLLLINFIYLIDNSLSLLISPVIYFIVLALLLCLLIFYIDKSLPAGGAIKYKSFIILYLVVLLMFVVFEFTFNHSQGLSSFVSFNWLTNFIKGIFPYKNHYASNLPFLYYIDSPFFLLGSEGIISLFGLILFFILLLQISFTNKELIIRSGAFLLLPIVYYEVVTGGDSLTNAVLIISIILILNKFVSADKVNIKLVFLSFLFGAFLCTRIVAVIPILLSVLFFFRNNIKNLLLFVLLLLLVCFALIAPFIRWDYSSFTLFGPFTGATAELPIWVYIVLFIILIYAGWMISDMQELFFVSGLILFFTSLIILLRGENYYDEMVFSLPFFILSIKEYQVDKFLGKKIPIK
jgi:hypothetical protein